MPTMDKQQVLEAVEEAITEGGNIVIRFGWGQMRTLRQEEAELLLAALKPSQSYVPCQRSVLKAVDDEPEVPGSMPDEMWAAIRDDRDAVEEAVRIGVRQTKEGIRKRLLSLFISPSE